MIFDIKLNYGIIKKIQNMFYIKFKKIKMKVRKIHADTQCIRICN